MVCIEKGEKRWRGGRHPRSRPRSALAPGTTAQVDRLVPQIHHVNLGMVWFLVQPLIPSSKATVRASSWYDCSPRPLVFRVQPLQHMETHSLFNTRGSARDRESAHTGSNQCQKLLINRDTHHAPTLIKGESSLLTTYWSESTESSR